MSVVMLSTGYFPDPTIGRPVSEGFIFVGEPDTDPTIVGNQKQISVLQEDTTTVDVAQPLRTSAGGVPIYNGSPVTVIVSGDYSLTVLSKTSVQKYYIPHLSDFSDSFVISFDTVADMVASSDLIVGNSVTTLGFYSAGDGGGNDYLVVAAATGSDDGGSYIDLDTHQAKGLFPGGEADFRQFGAVANGAADDTTQLENTILFVEGSSEVVSLKFSPGNYKFSTGLTASSIDSFVGGGYDSTTLSYYGSGTALTFASVRKTNDFNITSEAASQNGIHVVGGASTEMQQLEVDDFDGFGVKLGRTSPATAQYFSDINHITINNQNRAGTNGFVIEGTFPKSNLNHVVGVHVKGMWDRYFDIEGNDNKFVNCQTEVNNSAHAVTEVIRISGIGNRFEGQYFETSGATEPETIANFTSTSVSNRFENTYYTAGQPNENIYAAVTDDGISNEFSMNLIGTDFPSNSKNVSYENLASNSEFRGLADTGVPVGWQATTTGGATVTRVTTPTRGGAYSMQMVVSSERANLNCWLSTTNPSLHLPLIETPVEKFQGKTMAVGVWVKSSVANLGAVKLFTGGPSVGTASHSGSGNWEFLVASGRVTDTATGVAIELRTNSSNSDSTGTVRFSEPIIVLGNELPQQVNKSIDDSDAAMAGRFTWNPPPTLTVGSTVPSVADGNFFLEAEIAARFYTNFPNGREGQEIKILTTTTNVTFVDGATIHTTTGSNKAAVIDTIYKFILHGTVWHEF